MTSCGLNDGPLETRGEYSAFYACNITDGHMPTIERDTVEEQVPFLTNDDKDHYLTDISDGTTVGFKYFEFNGATDISINTRGAGIGKFQIYADKEFVGEIEVNGTDKWTNNQISVNITGTKALYLKYSGTETKDMLSIEF